MQFEALKVFCDVVRCRSFSQAAQANDLSQSAASQIVLQLEKRLDVQLIDRSTRPLRPTALGRTYYEGCKGLVEQYLELEALIRNARDQVEATVEVAAIYSVGLGDMGQHVERFTAGHPKAKVHIEYLHPNRVLQRVLEGTVDFGLVSFPRKSRDLHVLPWREEDMVVACAPGHPFARHRSVKMDQLAGVKYIGFDRDLGIRREVDRFLREQGITVEIVLEFDNIENIKKAIEIGAGVALLPEPTLRREVEAGTLAARPLTGGRFVRPLAIVCGRHHKLSTTAAHFLELLRDSGGNGSSRHAGPGAFASSNGKHERANGDSKR